MKKANWADGGRIFSFPPVADENSRILILGTMPSRRSLEQQAFYAHPQNALWRILGDFLDTDLRALPFPSRYDILRENGIALYDVCASCEREGSLDTNIRDALPNDIPALLESSPRIGRILCNGKTSYALLRRHFPDIAEQYAQALPSTSPAHTLPYAEKYAIWRAALTLTD